MRKKWTEQAIKEDAMRYSSIESWRNASSAYQIAHKMGIIRDVTAHMSRPKVHNKKWTIDSTLEEALNFKSRGEWRERSGSSYTIACCNGWLDICTKHMKKHGNRSVGELEVKKFIESDYPNTKCRRFTNKSFHPVIKKFELDIFIPELNKGIEFNGDYWHSEEGLSRGRDHWPSNLIKNYHPMKREFFKSYGIEYLEIWEHEWNANKDQCLARIKEFLKIPC